MSSAFIYLNNFLITENKTFPLCSNSMHMLLVHFCNIFVGVQVIGQAGAISVLKTWEPYTNLKCSFSDTLLHNDRLVAVMG
jgi:hypothetical protein